MSNPFHPDRDSNAAKGVAFADEVQALEYGDGLHDAFTDRATGVTWYGTDMHREADGALAD